MDGLLPHEADDLVDQLAALTGVGHERLDPTAGGVDFFAWLRGELVRLVRELPLPSRRLAREVGLPGGDRLAELLARREVRARPPVLLHGDLNPWNLVRGQGPDRGLTLIDWEMAVVGDPLYDLVRHLHLTPTRPEIRRRMLARWSARLPARHTMRLGTGLERVPDDRDRPFRVRRSGPARHRRRPRRPQRPAGHGVLCDDPAGGDRRAGAPAPAHRGPVPRARLPARRPVTRRGMGAGRPVPRDACAGSRPGGA